LRAHFDVEKMLNDRAAQSPEQLNWKNSIVDLMKLLDIDSSLGARKEFAIRGFAIDQRRRRDRRHPSGNAIAIALRSRRNHKGKAIQRFLCASST
jgi:hypothetical protein